VLFVIVEPILITLIWDFIMWLPAIVAEAYVLYILWFCAEFNYLRHTHWRYFVYPQAVLAINLLLACFAPWLLGIVFNKS
jgi:hypothetical protein